ncbi:MAG TPA: methyltransferase domain-containing protein [Bryobacteraceae bacterium]|nr:methyltransferase domain-containing protein [Bryobacteraceae bacterium]
MKFLILWGAVALASAQVAEKANERYQTPDAREGIARTLTESSRDARQKPRELVAALGIKPGMTVVDFGTGPGYMLPYLSDAVGKNGRVIGQDIFSDFLAKAKERAVALSNVNFVQGNAKETKLSPESADLVMALDVYHHLDYPAQTLAEVKRALKPNGRLAIIEYHKNDVAMGGRAKEHVRLGEDDAIKEIEENGFRLVSKKDFVPQVQWLAIFEQVTLEPKLRKLK